MERPDDLAPETHNSEQDDEPAQAQTIAEDAKNDGLDEFGETTKVGDSGLMGDSTQDLVDHMNDMVNSGRIDMGAYRGEPKMDDSDEDANAED